MAGIAVVLSLISAAVEQKQSFDAGKPTGDEAVVNVLESEAQGDFHRISAAVITGDTATFGGLGATFVDSFEIASLTKVFTGELLRLQLDRGEISKSTTVGDILGPRVAGAPVATVTMEELANHTSGLPRLGNVGIRSRLAPLFDRNPYEGISVDDVIAMSTEAKLRSRGEFTYSNLGYALLGHVLAVNAGIGYEHLLNRDILEPLGLEGTRLMTPGSLPPDAAYGYTPSGKRAEPWEMDGFLPAAGLRSTAQDMAIFSRHLLKEGPPPFTWQPLDGHPGIAWHNGESFGFASVIFLDPGTSTATFVTADVAASVFRMGEELLKNTPKPVSSITSRQEGT